jgi:phenylalanine-4-hydroxylase
MTTTNENVNRLPVHLRKYIVEQNYQKYTAVDHAVWRYIMRLNYDFLKRTAHKSYLDGLLGTGISIERIPKIDEMNEILSKIGWGAVCVDGFIPPAAFMEFQAYKVLVIAADMRNINHIEYTPAPDIVHEAAGHAPIIVDHAYAEYLRLFGEIGSKAISSKRDNDLYEAVRKLSILKEKSGTAGEEIKKAEQELFDISNDMGKPSEMARLRNLHWWTVEYGLIGELNNPQIYGAGLLSLYW